MRTSTPTVSLNIVAIIVFATPVPTLAGNLDPPAGPIAPTHKTLTEVEPRIVINDTNTPGDADSLFKITAPGSYYLSGNVTGVTGKSGIEIEASGVTVDLMGFELAGVTGSIGGIRTFAPAENVEVKNGVVRGWGAPAGVYLLGAGSRASNLRVSDNAQRGIDAALNAVITDCVAYQNGTVGIQANASSISNCTAYENNDGGIANFLGSITNCTANSNGAGITSLGGVVAHCAAYYNAIGIVGTQGATISDCSASTNTDYGIAISDYGTVRDSTCWQNFDAGIFVGAIGWPAASWGARIEGNNCTLNGNGIVVATTGNVIVRNTCADNAVMNWDIVADNVYGPIIDRTVPASAAVTGNSGAGSMGSTDPNANFTY